ncbi:MAG: hypothetical protein KDK70_24600 [Myxococcales bacterium]|nr:hypothetical protein [Myxococcales bacterium]
MGVPSTVGLALLGVLASGPLTCLEAGEDEPAPTRTARQIWMTDCVRCHGAQGRGDGPDAAGLSPAVPDFGDPCRPRSAERIEQAILQGAESFEGNPAMRPHHELRDAREVLVELVGFVQAMRAQGECPGGGA